MTGHGNGVCTSCGGLGGSGTTSKYKNRFSDFLATYGSGYKGQGNWAGYGGYSNCTSSGSGSGSGSKSGSNNSSELGRLAAGAGSGALDLTKTALTEVTDLAESAGSGATGLLRDTGSGAVGLLRDTGSGATGLLRDAGSGAAGLLKSNPTQLGNNPYGQQNGGGPSGYNAGYNNPYQSGYYSQGTYNLPNNPLGVQGIDPYSYNGALVSKGGNYIPITDDFSSFRK